jgi:hypothetical protein
VKLLFFQTRKSATRDNSTRNIENGNENYVEKSEK